MESMRSRWALVGSCLILGATAAGGAESQEAADEETRAAMSHIVSALAIALPASIDPAEFASAERRAEVLSALRVLALEAGRLENHAQDQDAGFGLLSRALSEDAREVAARYEAGKTDEARFLLHRLTDSCVACHSRLPDSVAHPVGRRLAEAPAVAKLPLDERATIEVATRQFDRALESYETLMADPEVAPADLDLMGTLDTYIEVALRVREDRRRPRKALERLARRTDVPEPLAETLAIWIDSLRQLEASPPTGTPLAQARSLMEQARNRSRFPDDRRALVYYVAASGVLHRAVARKELAREDRAEACYRLGLIESRVGRAFWISQTETWLEAAIRAAPDGPYAPDALVVLEEFVASGWTGSAGGEVPPEKLALLTELRELVREAQDR